MASTDPKTATEGQWSDLVSRIKTEDSTLQSNIDKKRIYYGTSSTAASTNEKIVTTVDGNFKLETGAVLFVGFTYKCAGSPAYLKVDGTTSTRVATIMQDTGTYNIWAAKEVVGFVYDGTHFVCFGRKSASTSSYGLTYLTTSATADYEYTSATPQSINLLAQNMLAGANVYSTTATYAVGDLCRHEYKIYVCNTAITTAEAWTAAHWTALPSFQSQIDTLSSSKQDTLVSGTNIKTINSTSLLGSGNINIPVMQNTAISSTDFITLTTGYSVVAKYTSISKIDKTVIVNLVIKKDSGNFPASQTVVGNIKSGYRPSATINYACIYGAEYSINGLGYLYIVGTNGSVTLTAPDANSNYAKISITYCTS